jgi:hypothetical protein
MKIDEHKKSMAQRYKNLKKFFFINNEKDEIAMIIPNDEKKLSNP